MRAIEVNGFGGPEVLVPVERPDPVPGADDVVIRAAAIDTIYLDTLIRGGWGEAFGVEPPYVPGGAAAGTVESVGSGVDPTWTGRRVLAGPGTTGAYAELVRTAIDRLVPVPDDLGLPEAAALAHDGVTATGLVEAMEITLGERVLILGAGGGMGTLLVQMAHAAGAHVIGAARGVEKLDLVKGLGADATVDYSETDWIERVREAADRRSIDVLLDGVGGELGAAAFALVGDKGRVSTHGVAAGGFARLDDDVVRARDITVRGIEHVQFEAPEMVRLATRALAEAAAGRLRPVIDKQFDLSEATAAHRAIENRTVRGKALLIP
ncbi:NADPH:quinone reductase [Aeromicrobium sp. Root236]|nr:NADPH:quinone reductase [Aeromicrobium sp. Root236]